MIQMLQPEFQEETTITATDKDVRLSFNTTYGDSYTIILERGDILDYVADRLCYYKLADQIVENNEPPF